jgi:DNA-binding CsgD family transcriptional regulator
LPDSSARITAVTASMFASDAAYFVMIVCWVTAAETLMGGYKTVNRTLLAVCAAAYGVVAEGIVASSLRALDGVIVLRETVSSRVLMALNFAFGCFILYCGVRLVIHGAVRLLRQKERWRVLIAPMLFSLCLVYYMAGTVGWDYRIVSGGALTVDNLSVINPAALAYLILCTLLVMILHAKGYYIMGKGDPGRMSADGVEKRRAFLTEKFALSPRESEVLALVLNGKSNAAIARALFISEHTVKRHLHTVFKKTGCSGRYELIAGPGDARGA